MSDVALYETGLNPLRVMLALALPCIGASIGVGFACGMRALAGDGLLFIATLLVLAGLILAAGLTTVLLAALGPRAETRRIDRPRSLRRAPAPGLRSRQPA